MQVNPFNASSVTSKLGGSKQAKYLASYLKEIGASKYVVEEEYVDKDYLTDYCRFYARSHERFERYTTRLHFFAGACPKGDLIDCLDSQGINRIQSDYLGYIVVKPVKDGKGRKPLIGKTILKTYEETDGSDRRKFIKEEYRASLYGIDLHVDSMPFQAQDNGVSACATIALWSAIHPLCRSFKTPRHSPSEITEISFQQNMASPPSIGRVFPSDGLTLWQIVSYIRSINLDIESIDIENKIKENKSIVKDTVKTYVDSSLPIIAVLEMTGKNKSGCHAAVISGYRYDKSGDVKELYVHDDQIGPFSRVKSKDNFESWENEWLKMGYDKVLLRKFIIPLYPKIRLPYMKIYPFYEGLRKKVDGKGLQLNVSLKQVKEYKAELLKSDIENKKDRLKALLPRFMWVMSLRKGEIKLADGIYDATSIYPRTLDNEFVTYK